MIINLIIVKKWISFLFVMVSINLFCQNNTIDSLKNIVQTKAKDSSMVLTINKLCKELLKNNQLDKVIEYSNQAIALADKIDFKKGKAYALKNIGIAGYYQGDYLSVMDHWTQSLEVFETISDTLGIANMSSNLGVIYYDQGSHDKALNFYFKSLTYSEKLKDLVRISTALVNIGGVYTQMKDYQKALDYYKQVEKYLPKLNDQQIKSTYLMGIGEVNSLRGNYKNALSYYKKALQINKNSEDYAHNLTMIGVEEAKLGNTKKAIDFLDKALKTAEKSNLTLDKIQTLLALGNIYQKSDIPKALDSYQKAEILALEMETNEELRDIYKGISASYAAKNDYKNAFKYQTKYLTQKDLVFNTETDDKIRGLQFDFDLNKKQDKISLLEKEAKINQLQGKRQKNLTYASVIASVLVLLLAFGTYRRYRFIKKTNHIIEEEKNRSENLLLNILPEETAIELKQNGKVQAKQFGSVTVMFTDFKEFTRFSQSLSPENLVKSVDYYFSKFDEIMEKYKLEKIKTIGDAYMCAGGLPFPSEDHAFKMIKAAFEITTFVEEMKNRDDLDIEKFEIRVGINTGPVVAGVVGTKKFAYDIWGDTVNVASRMESNSIPGKINISETTYKLIKEKYDCDFRGEIKVKNKGIMKMYFVNGFKNKEITERLITKNTIA